MKNQKARFMEWPFRLIRYVPEGCRGDEISRGFGVAWDCLTPVLSGRGPCRVATMPIPLNVICGWGRKWWLWCLYEATMKARGIEFFLQQDAVDRGIKSRAAKIFTDGWVAHQNYEEWRELKKPVTPEDYKDIVDMILIDQADKEEILRLLKL